MSIPLGDLQVGVCKLRAYLQHYMLHFDYDIKQR